MKQTKLLLVLLFFSCPGIAQDAEERTMVYNLTMDTVLKPDYYAVSISVSEYLQYQRLSKKETRVTIVSLDTLSERLMRHLVGLGLKQGIHKSSVTEADNGGDYFRRTDTKLFQVTYSFRLFQKDSVDYLFSSIDKTITSGMRVTPEVYDATVEKAKQSLIPKGMQLATAYADEIAKKMNQKISKSKYNIVFYEGGVNNNFNDFTKKFLIDYKDINYKLTINYTYSFAEN